MTKKKVLYFWVQAFFFASTVVTTIGKAKKVKKEKRSKDL